ncbi:MAG: hypothetical protein Q9167_002690 [Letrouitia subvulpina]
MPKSGKKDFSTTQDLTIRHLPWTYFHLSLQTTSNPVATAQSAPIDIITARRYLSSALQQFLGLTGTAICIDILKVDGRDVWLRVPSDDRAAVTNALSSWVGAEEVAWIIRGKEEWLAGLVAGNGDDHFDP